MRHAERSRRASPATSDAVVDGVTGLLADDGPATRRRARPRARRRRRSAPGSRPAHSTTPPRSRGARRRAAPSRCSRPRRSAPRIRVTPNRSARRRRGSGAFPESTPAAPAARLLRARLPRVRAAAAHRSRARSRPTRSSTSTSTRRACSRAPSMWDPNIGLGTVTHQNIGYLFPMGPYYWLLDTLGVPDWIAQRLWLGTLVFFAGLGRALPAAHVRRARPGRRRRRARVHVHARTRSTTRRASRCC